MGETGPTLQRFLASVDERLQELPSDQRAAFLRIFSGTPPREHKKLPVDTTWPVGDDPLLHDTDAFVDRVASGKYFEGFGWDDDIHDQRSFGDESWASEMDMLFGDTQDAFCAGGLGLARAAYQRLLGALHLDEEVGTFCGAQPAVEMVETDIAEAESRYLRAVYETSPQADRVAALAEEWFHLPTWGRPPSLREVREALPWDVPDLESFLPEWIAQLQSTGAERPEQRRLLAEAVEVYGGVDGLAVLARDSDPGQAERYLDWVDALRRAERRTDAAAAAQEALNTLASYGETRARIAEHLAELVDDDAAEVLAARRSAWRASPTDPRLLILHNAATATCQGPQVAAEEIEALKTGGEPQRLSGRLTATLMLLAGRTADALGFLEVAEDGDPRRSASRVLVPYLLAAGCAGPRRREWSTTRAAALLRSVDHPGAWDWTSDDGQRSDAATGAAARLLSALLTEEIAGAPDDPERRTQWLKAALRAVDRHVDAVVSGQNRAWYSESARLVACCAEAVTLEEDADAGTLLVAQMRDRYPRHVAFRRELDTAVRQTPLVMGPPTKGRP